MLVCAAGFESSVFVESVAVEASDDEEPEADDESADGSATATHGVVATAVPMPSATASAPPRPTYFALPIVVPPRTPTLFGVRIAFARETKCAAADWLG